MKKAIFVSAILILLFAPLQAQDTTYISSETTHEIWTEAGGQLKLGKNWRFNFTQSVRFSDKTGGYKLGFSEYGLQYKLNDAMALKLKGRFTFEPGDSNYFKFYFDYTYALQKKGYRLRTDYRFRFEETPNTFKYGREIYIRNRFGLEYNLSKLVDPFVQYELFYCLDGGLPRKFTDHRFYGGIQWNFGKRLGLSTAYFFNQEIQDVVKITRKGNVKIYHPDAMHAFVVELEYSF